MVPTGTSRSNSLQEKVFDSGFFGPQSNKESQEIGKTTATHATQRKVSQRDEMPQKFHPSLFGAPRANHEVIAEPIFAMTNVLKVMLKYGVTHLSQPAISSNRQEDKVEDTDNQEKKQKKAKINKAKHWEGKGPSQVEV
ncbi:hypothetical protein Tco_0527562 [Tanacetum coccineum]